MLRRAGRGMRRPRLHPSATPVARRCLGSTKDVNYNVSTSPDVSFETVSRAHMRLRKGEGVKTTQMVAAPKLSELFGMKIHMKREYEQVTGSFKERGARNALLRLQDAGAVGDGVICASAGNHALALAYHAQQLGIKCTAVMPSAAPLTKVNNCRSYGAEVLLHGEHIGAARERADAIVASGEAGQLTYINGFDDADIISGAGTMGIEVRTMLLLSLLLLC